MSQNSELLAWLKSGKEISTYQAFTDLGITRLSARISDLKHMGCEIDHTDRVVKTRSGEKTSVRFYKLKEKE